MCYLFIGKDPCLLSGECQRPLGQCGQPGSLRLRLTGTEMPSDFRDGEAGTGWHQGQYRTGRKELQPCLQRGTVRLQVHKEGHAKLESGPESGCHRGAPNTPNTSAIICLQRYVCRSWQPNALLPLKTKDKSVIGCEQQSLPLEVY